MPRWAKAAGLATVEPRRRKRLAAEADVLGRQMQERERRKASEAIERQACCAIRVRRRSSQGGHRGRTVQLPALVPSRRSIGLPEPEFNRQDLGPQAERRIWRSPCRAADRESNGARPISSPRSKPRPPVVSDLPGPRSSPALAPGHRRSPAGQEDRRHSSRSHQPGYERAIPGWTSHSGKRSDLGRRRQAAASSMRRHLRHIPNGQH